MPGCSLSIIPQCARLARKRQVITFVRKRTAYSSARGGAGMDRNQSGAVLDRLKQCHASHSVLDDVAEEFVGGPGTVVVRVDQIQVGLQQTRLRLALARLRCDRALQRAARLFPGLQDVGVAWCLAA